MSGRIDSMMKKRFVRILCVLLSLAMIVLAVSSCAKQPGLYNWWGGKMNVDYMLKLTLNVGNGDVVYDVPFDLYRNLFVYYKSIISDVTINENNVAVVATNAQKTAVLKEHTEDEIVEYYALTAIAEKYGVGFTDADKDLYEREFEKQAKTLAATLTEEDLKGYNGTALDYAKEKYNEVIVEKLKMTAEYFEYLFYKNLLLKRVKQAVVPNLADSIKQCYYHYEEVYIEYVKGDGQSETEAYQDILKAYDELENGAAPGDVVKKYSNNVLYNSDMYFDSYGRIVGNDKGSSLGSTIIENVLALEEGEHSNILTGEGSDDQTAYFAIVIRLEFDENALYSEQSIATQMFRYAYVGATSDTTYYTDYNDILNAYTQNIRVEPYEEKVYDRVAYNTMY